MILGEVFRCLLSSKSALLFIIMVAISSKELVEYVLVPVLSKESFGTSDGCFSEAEARIHFHAIG